MKLQSLILIATFLSCFSTSYAQVGTCEKAQADAILNAGNIRAQIFNNGALFWNGGQNLYESPKNSGLHSIFMSSFVLTGYIDGDLRAAATTYGPYEFWPGPLDANGNPPSDCSEYDRIWEINDDDFLLFDQTGIFSENMLNWPWQLGAPVIDGDGTPDNYDLEGGDRPELLGNQTLWWIMNDRGNEHEWSETLPLGLEVRTSAFAFDHNGLGGDITFYKYHITNRNTKPITDALLGMWADPDIGNVSDDYFGSDSLLNLAYVYNGDNIDENGYEKKPPAIGYTFLITPEAPLDNFDNDRDGQVDEPGESTSMYAAMQHVDGGGPFNFPKGAQTLNYVLKGKWIDGASMVEGGYGYRIFPFPAGFPRVTTRFMYSGDPLTRSFWTEFRILPDSNEPLNPGDKRFTASSGPFTLLPGESTEFLLAIVWAQGENWLDSVRKLKAITGNLQSTPEAYLISGIRAESPEPLPPDPEFVLGFDQNFPNPFTDATTIQYSLPKTMHVRLSVYDVLGREVALLAAGTQAAGIYAQELDGSQLAPGIYYTRLEADYLSFTKKMIKMLSE